jgi:hypothetical protein
VRQLVRNEISNEHSWELMQVVGLPVLTVFQPRFQIFTSGIVARHTFLIDTDTGATWMLRSSNTNKDVALWEKFEGLP